MPLCHVHICCSCCCELIDTHAFSTHRSRVLVRQQFLLPAYVSLIFATFLAAGMGVGLYVGRLVREYIRYLFIFSTIQVHSTNKVTKLSVVHLALQSATIDT